MSTADHHKNTLPPQLHPKVRQAGHMSHPQAPLLLCTQPLLGNVRLADSQRDIGVASLCVCVCVRRGDCVHKCLHIRMCDVCTCECICVYCREHKVWLPHTRLLWAGACVQARPAQLPPKLTCSLIPRGG